MNSRMDKYTETPSLKSRSERNKNLYEQIKTVDINNYEINSNATIIGEDISRIDVDKVKDMLDRRYSDNYNKINLELKDEEEIEQNDKIYDTKEYDINAILEKAKKDQNVDYDKERLMKVHNTQYDILKNLNINNNSLEDKIDDSEENLVNLINTITNLEMKNSKNKNGSTTALDLLSDLDDSDTNTVYKTMELDKEAISESTHENLDEEDLAIEEKFDDFRELERDLKSNNIAIKIVGIVFAIIILILAFIFFNNYFNLGLF